MTFRECCADFALGLRERRIKLIYSPKVREYGFPLYYSSSIWTLNYCPWCGTKLPESLREIYFETLEKELGIDNDDNDLELPEEMRTDAWWKKRGL